MRFPQYYRRPNWQRFFAGLTIGTLIGWFFFLYQFGAIHQHLTTEMKKKQLTIEEQAETIDILRSNEKKLNEENELKLTIQHIQVSFLNAKKHHINELSLYELKQQLLKEIKHLEGKNIATIAATKEMLIKTIENKVFTLDERHFQLKTKQLYLYTTLEIYVEIIPYAP